MFSGFLVSYLLIEDMKPMYILICPAVFCRFLQLFTADPHHISAVFAALFQQHFKALTRANHSYARFFSV